MSSFGPAAPRRTRSAAERLERVGPPRPTAKLPPVARAGSLPPERKVGIFKANTQAIPNPPPPNSPRFKPFSALEKSCQKWSPSFKRIVGFGSLTGFFNWGVWTWGGVFGEGHWYLIQDLNKKRETGWKVPLFGIFNRSCWRVQWRAEI